MRERLRFKVYKRYSSDVWSALLNGRNLNMAYRLSLILRRVDVLSRDRDFRDLFDSLSVGRKGVRGRSRRAPRFSMYKVQLHARRRIQCFYQIYKSRQLRAVFLKSSRFRGLTEDNFFGVLESRVCTVVFRAGLFTTMIQARQYILHNGVFVNGRRTNRPGYPVGVGDLVSLPIGDFYSNLRPLPVSGPVDYYRPTNFSKLSALRRKRLRVNRFRHIGYPSLYMEVSYVSGCIAYFSRPAFSSIFYPFEFRPLDVISFYA